jgi:hypothetical protein
MSFLSGIFSWIKRHPYLTLIAILSVVGGFLLLSLVGVAIIIFAFGYLFRRKDKDDKKYTTYTLCYKVNQDLSYKVFKKMMEYFGGTFRSKSFGENGFYVFDGGKEDPKRGLSISIDSENQTLYSITHITSKKEEVPDSTIIIKKGEIKIKMELKWETESIDGIKNKFDDELGISYNLKFEPCKI